MNSDRAGQEALILVAFLNDHSSHIAKNNIRLISSDYVQRIILSSQAFGLNTVGLVKALALLIYNYSSPDEYLQDPTFLNELKKTEITPEVRIMNIHDNLKLREIKAQ